MHWATCWYSEAAAKTLTGLKTLEVAPGPELRAAEPSYKWNFYPPFQMSATGLETFLASLPKDTPAEIREQLRELAARWLHRG